MTAAVVTLVISAVLSGAVIVVFVMLVVGIHAGDRPRRLTDAPHSPLESITRAVLGVGVRTAHPASTDDGEKDS
jgi:hypothetical protein